MKYKAAAFTDIGAVKKVNQDSLTVQIAETSDSEILFAMVCDGMGGYSKGELVSATVITAFSEWFSHELPDYLCENGKITADDVKKKWQDIMSEQNEKILAYNKTNNIKSGTTAAGILVYDNKYIIANIGDSRVYFIQDGKINQLTTDHNVKNLFSQEQIKKMNFSDTALTRCIGLCQKAQPDFFEGELGRNTDIIICSDGFRNKLSQDEIRDYFIECSDEESMKNQIIKAFDEVKQRGERDNISAIVVSQR